MKLWNLCREGMGKSTNQPEEIYQPNVGPLDLEVQTKVVLAKIVGRKIASTFAWQKLFSEGTSFVFFWKFEVIVGDRFFFIAFVKTTFGTGKWRIYMLNPLHRECGDVGGPLATWITYAYLEF